MSGEPRNQRRNSASVAISDLGVEATRDIAAHLNALLADTFALYLKTKNFHWHVSGPHFRDYQGLLDEHARQVYATTDAFAERVRKIGARTLHSIGDIARRQRVVDNDADSVAPHDMLTELLRQQQRASQDELATSEFNFFLRNRAPKPSAPEGGQYQAHAEQEQQAFHQSHRAIRRKICASLRDPG